MRIKPFSYLIAIISILFLFAACSSQDQNSAINDTKEVHIGYQKGNTLNILKARGTLEERLETEGYTVKWSHFPMGSVLLEGLNTGSIDFGHSSDGNSVFAQASGKPVIYVASESPYPQGVAIVAPADSSIQSVQDLKGKRVAMSKGGNMQYLLVRSLEKEGLTFDDVEPIYYKDAAEARAIFDSGNLDALGIWDPYLAVLEEDVDLKLIINGEDPAGDENLTDNRTYYFASEELTSQHPELVKIILEELEKSNQWANEHPTEVAEILATELDINEAAMEKATKRREYGIQKIDQQVIDVQQTLADTFHDLKLIPEAVDIAETINLEPNWLPDGIE